MSMQHRYWKKIVPFVFFLTCIVLWELLVTAYKVPQYLFPAPSAIWQGFLKSYWSLTYDVIITAVESLVGFIVSIVFAGGIAIFFSHSRTVHDTFMPYLIGLKAVPIIAIAPLLVIWMGNGFLSKAVMVATICFFPIVVNLTRGFREIPEDQIDLFKSLGANRSQIFLMVRVPNALPYLFAALKIASTLSVVGAIVAEFAGANQGIGYVILVAALRIDTPLLFCGIILASVLGLLLYYGLELIESRVLFWEKSNE